MSEEQTEKTAKAAKIDALVAETGGVYTDERGNVWNVGALHYNWDSYARYTTTINGERIEVSGPNWNEHFTASHDWTDGARLLEALGKYRLSCDKFTSLEDAIEWAYRAPEFAEEAVNRHVNRGRVEAAVRKLDQEKDEAIEAITRKRDEQVAVIYSKAGLSPENNDL